MELFDPYAHFHPVESIPELFSVLADLNSELRHTPETVFERIAKYQYAVRVICGSGLLPYLALQDKGKPSQEDGEVAVSHAVSNRRKIVLPLDIALPANLDYEDRLYIGVQALVTTVGLEAIRALGASQEAKNECLSVLSLAKARTLHLLFNRFWGQEMMLADPIDGKDSSYFEIKEPDSVEDGENKLLAMMRQ